jgi:polysaccharide export outer membrane protein
MFNKAVRSFALVTGLLSAALLAAQTQSTPASAPATPSRPAIAASDVAPPSDYTIGAEDVLGVVFWREPEMSGDVTVRPDGRITIPVIGEIVAAGKRPDQLQAEIVTAATKYISGVNVVVVVRTINSRRIFVTGRVATPGKYPLIGPLTVMQAIALAGGLTEFADPKGITILRTENGRTTTFHFNYQDVSRGKSLEQNILLKPGDTVVVP